MKNLCLILVFIMLAACQTKTNEKKLELKGDYFGETPPGVIPQIFAPNVISTGVNEMSLTISNDLKNIYISRSCPDWSSGIVHFECIKGEWKKPQIPSFVQGLSDNYPMFSPDNSKMYFNSGRSYSLDSSGGFRRKIWVCKLENKTWSVAELVNINIKIPDYATSPVVSANENIYFNSELNGQKNSDIYVVEKDQNGYKTPKLLDATINTGYHEFHPYISPDETILLFDAVRSEGYGSNDIYASFKLADGKWSKAVNMGSDINTEYSDMRPYISPDGKYLFFCSNRSDNEVKGKINYCEFENIMNGPGNGSQDIYWVSIEVLEKLKEDTISFDIL